MYLLIGMGYLVLEMACLATGGICLAFLMEYLVFGIVHLVLGRVIIYQIQGSSFLLPSEICTPFCGICDKYQRAMFKIRPNLGAC